ncbi:hypothetical protein [Streptosporangium carneum]|uniref:Uncharacterized protein n=1 Tax=Streptosporangium carneum TaxID=47481 RepID=A0A9W6HZ39_9ACTN|nr:hypothetical protein [Streptosporangium carneum]GLK08451.1 hypothetical protein GCM10017600_18560 [Streptosporangium carneum]
MSHGISPQGGDGPPLDPQPGVPPRDGSPSAKPPLFTLRTLLVLSTAVVVGLVIGVLSFMGGVAPPLAVVAGLSACGLTVVGLHTLLD